MNGGLVLGHLQQLLWVDTVTVGGGVTGGSFYIDNVYFYSPASPLAVSITSPAPNATVSPSFQITANATVSPGTVTNVNFYDGATLLGNSTTSPYSYNVSGASLGAHALKAIARDSSGNSATSSVVNITVAAVLPVAAYEPFNYTTLANGAATTASGFTGNWTIGGTVTLDTGMTYPSLPTSNKAFKQAPGNRSQVSLANSLSGGTVYVSFLFNQLGNNGGDLNGVYFPGSGANSLFCGFGVFGGDTATTGKFGLASVATSGGASGGTSFAMKTGVKYNQAHLAVLKIDFNTSGANDTVSLWIDPPAGTNSPGTIADVTYGSFDVGTISGIGFNFQGGGAQEIYDEIRVGSTYGDVVGSSAGATVPTTLALSVASGKEVSWSASSGNFYQPQKSTDNSTWSDLGGLLNGSAVNSVYDAAPVAYYQVLEIAPVITEQALNGGFETDDGFGGAASWEAMAVSQPPTRTTPVAHSGSYSMFISATNNPGGPNTSEIQQNLVNQGGAAIVGGNTYDFSFWAQQVSSGPGYVQQYKITWLDGTSAIVGAVGWTSFTGGTGTWTQISAGSVVAPATAVNALIQIVGLTGADVGAYGGVLIDDVSLTTTTPTGATTVLAATVQPGAVFTATVQTNGVTATAATGTVSFQTNNVAQSTGIVGSGTASSARAIVPPSYTITAIYSGDGIYMGSTNTLVVGGSYFGTGPGSVTLASGHATVVMSGIAGNQYSMQRATNVLFTAGISNFPTATAPPGGSVTNVDNFSDLGAVPEAAFYRLHYIP